MSENVYEHFSDGEIKAFATQKEVKPRKFSGRLIRKMLPLLASSVMMFSSIVVSGIQLITKEPLSTRNISIVSVALGVGYGLGANCAALASLPQGIQLIFGGSGIVPAALVAILMNILLPKEKEN